MEAYTIDNRYRFLIIWVDDVVNLPRPFCKGLWYGRRKIGNAVSQQVACIELKPSSGGQINYTEHHKKFTTSMHIQNSFDNVPAEGINSEIPWTQEKIIHIQLVCSYYRNWSNFQQWTGKERIMPVFWQGMHATSFHDSTVVLQHHIVSCSVMNLNIQCAFGWVLP